MDSVHLPKNTYVGNYHFRIEETKRKIDSISQKLEYLIQRKGLDHGKWMTQLNLIWCALGVYDVSGVEREERLGFVWRVWRTPTAEGNHWMEYFGNQSIRERGGTIVLMLSNDGVSYGNDISYVISSYYSSYTTTE